MKDVCIIGGSRYFGRLLVERLRDEGSDVTVVNRGSSAAPEGVFHAIADRDDESGLTAALGDRTFDVVIDQVCYTPRQAAVARRVFANRTRRYVMTSTIEVYRPDAPDPGPAEAPVTEDAVDPGRWWVDLSLPWHDEGFRNSRYGEGKRQAEAVFSQRPVFPFVSVRSGHVLGPDDFTGRLSHYVERILTGEPVVVHRDPCRSSFIHHREIVEVLAWAAGADFAGAVNACSHVELGAVELCDLIASYGAPPATYRIVEPGSVEASPFSYDRYYGMDNSRAERLGFGFTKTTDWLPEVIAGAVAGVRKRGF